jgi:hypothetical protein
VSTAEFHEARSSNANLLQQAHHDPDLNRMSLRDQRIFDKFYRVRRGDRQRAGTGLGLAICRGFIEAMGGGLPPRTGPPGGGGFYDHASGRRHGDAARDAAMTPRAGPLRVLIVDDEPAIIRFLRASLQSQGYIVSTAGDAHRARHGTRRRR